MLPLALFLCFVASAHALSCLPCGTQPCEAPACCGSGVLTKDVCGCCDVCAKPLGDVCGGPWRINGRCATNLYCLRKCRCPTTPPPACKLPFKVSGVEFNGCVSSTGANANSNVSMIPEVEAGADGPSPAGRCPTEVDSSGEAVEGKWTDCTSECGVCDAGALFNVDGVCIDEAEKNNIETRDAKDTLPPSYELENGTESTSTPVPVCSASLSPADTPATTQCRCAAGNASSFCKHPDGGRLGEGPLAFGYCFLEHVADPTNPTKDCFEDARWSPTAGRFWSNLACKSALQ